MPCPNKNLESWKSLVSALGSEAKALAAYTLNNYDIPSVQEAELLLIMQEAKTSGKVKDKVKSELKELKLERVNDQITTLDRIIQSSPKDGRQETLKKIKQNLEEYRKVVEQEDTTVSVTNLFAGGELEDQEKYKDYAEFGTFQHYILESLQKETIGTDKSLTSVFSKAKLRELLKSYDKKFTINGLIENGTILNEDELYNMSNEILGILQTYTSMGYTILPEISVLAKDRFDRNIVGRLDMVAIDKNGKAVVIDLKSKKLKSTSTVDSLSYYWPVNSSAQTDAEFRGGTRNAYENWDIQLGIYARMLQQLGIDTDEKRILGLYYYGTYDTADGKQFNEKGEDTFNYTFYKVKSYLSSEFDKAGESDYLRYKNHMRKIAKVLPLAEEDVTPAREKNRDDIVFNMSPEQADKLVAKLTEITERELINARAKLKDAKKKDSGKNIIDYYEDRIQSLNQIKEALKQDAWDSAYKVGFVIQVLANDTAALRQTVESMDSIVNDSGLEQRSKDLDKFTRLAGGYNIVISQVRRLLTEAKVGEDSKAVQVLNQIENNIRSIRAEYNRLGLFYLTSMLKDSLSENQVFRINDQRKQLLEARIKRLEEKRSKLLSEGQSGSGFWYRISQKVSNVGRSALKSDLLNPENELENIEKQLIKLQVEMQGINLDDESVNKYIMAVLDPASPVYMGQGTTVITGGVAATASGDWVTSAYATQLKVAISNGIQDYVNFIEREKIQDEYDRYSAGSRNIAELNEAISEIRSVNTYDDNGNLTKIQRRAFVNPISQEYYDTIDDFRNKERLLSKKIQDETDPEVRKELKKQLSEQQNQFLEWRLENSQMEYVNEFYEIDKLLPAEYRQERDELFAEKRLLEASAGFNNAEELDEETIDRIAEIEVELNKLRKKYADMKEGGYARYLALQEKYYEYETNFNYYERLYNQKRIQLTDANGNVDIEALAKWKEQNTIKRPKEEWYQLVGEVWDEIFMIIGRSSGAVEGLNDRYKEILKQYRRRGVIDSRFMTQDDVDTLNEIENLIQIYKMASPSLGLSYEDRVQLTELFKDLEALQTRVENPFYIKEFNSRLDELELAWNNYQTEKEASMKDWYLEQFLLKEMDFKTWYDNNHTNKYQSKLVSDEALNPLPKKYNMLTIPTSEDMMEEVPDYKFSTRIIRPTAYNINQQVDALGYPMPKGLTIDEETYKVEGSSKWINPKYDQIRNNKRTSDFYHSFVSRFLRTQQETTGRMLGYNFPGYEQQSLADLREKGLKEGLKNRAKMFRDQNLAIGTDYDFSINGYGTEQDDRIQFKHNTPLPIEQQTTDGIAAVIRWYENAHVNKAMASAQIMSKSMISFMESLYQQLSEEDFPDKQNRMERMRRAIDQMNFEYKKFIKGEWKKDEGLIGRFGDLGLRAIGLSRLALDVPNQVGNMLSGNIQAFLGNHKSAHYSAKNMAWAKGQIYGRNGLIASMIKDYGKIGGKTFKSKMLLYWNPLGQSLDHYYNRTRSSGDRIKQGFLEGNFAMWIQDKGELEISSTIWLSILDNIKVKVVKSRDEEGNVTEYQKDENGNILTINAYEAYKENANGEVVIREDVEWTKKDEDVIKRTVWSEIRRTQGRYAEWDKTRAESGIVGRLIFFYRKYLEPFLMNRFGRRQTNYEAGEMAVGFYRALIDTYKFYGFRQATAAIFGSKKTEVSELYQQKSQMAARELAVSLAMMIIGRMLLSAIPDDDEDDKSFSKIIAYNLLAVYAKADMETRSMVPMVIIGDLDNYFQNFTSFTNVGRDVGRIGNLLEHGLALVAANTLASESEYWNKLAYYQKKTKSFDKGDAKIKKDIMALTGYWNYFELFNPEERVINYQRKMGGKPSGD